MQPRNRPPEQRAREQTAYRPRRSPDKKADGPEGGKREHKENLVNQFRRPRGICVQVCAENSDRQCGAHYATTDCSRKSGEQNESLPIPSSPRNNRATHQKSNAEAEGGQNPRNYLLSRTGQSLCERR